LPQYNHHNHRRYSFNDRYNTQSFNCSYSHTGKETKETEIVSTVSFSTEEMDSFDEMDLFDGCDDNDNDTKLNFDTIDIDIDINIDVTTSNNAVDVDGNKNKNVVTPSRKDDKKIPSLTVSQLSNSNEPILKQPKEHRKKTMDSRQEAEHHEGWESALESSTGNQRKNSNKNNDDKLKKKPEKGIKSYINNNSSNINNAMGDANILIRVEFPTECDILCGQSRACANHKGNETFQSTLDTYATRYDNATSKQEKMMITKEIVACIHDTGGRFLKYKNDDGVWEEISNVAARDKVSHALRTKVASWKRQQQQLLLREKEENDSSEGCGSSLKNSAIRQQRRRSSVTNGRSRRHRKMGSRCRRSYSSMSSIASNSTTAATTANDDSVMVVNDLMKAQQEIFATLTTSSSSITESTLTPTPDSNNVISNEGNHYHDHHHHNIASHPVDDMNQSFIPCRRSSSYF